MTTEPVKNPATDGLDTFLDYALKYYDLGINVIPLEPESKQSLKALGGWEKYQTEKVRKSQIDGK